MRKEGNYFNLIFDILAVSGAMGEYFGKKCFHTSEYTVSFYVFKPLRWIIGDIVSAQIDIMLFFLMTSKLIFLDLFL